MIRCKNLQSSLEYALKAIVAAQGMRVVHTHDLVEMWRQAESRGETIVVDPHDVAVGAARRERALEALSRYAGSWQYKTPDAEDPEETWRETKSMVRSAIDHATRRVPMLARETRRVIEEERERQIARRAGKPPAPANEVAVERFRMSRDRKRLVGVGAVVAGLISMPAAAQTGAPGAPAPLTLDAFRGGAACSDRSAQAQTAVVDSHLHFRPFGGPAVPFEEIAGYLEATGVLFANVYGIGQMLPASSSCTYYLDCPGTPVTPTLKNDFVNAANVVAKTPEGLHLTLAMTFPDLADPDSVVAGIELLDAEYPGLFRWMGEVNLVKQALFANGHEPVPVEAIGGWAGFMEVLRERAIPLAIHSDLGSDDDPTRYLPWMEEVLNRYPENPVVWVHMGLSRELTGMDPARHAALMTSMLERHPNLMLDVTWRVLDDAYFSTPEGRAAYVPFLNAHSERILPGTDFLASRDKDLEVYRTELEVTSRIFAHLHDEAFRDVALGGNYFRLLGLDYEPPPVCAK